MLGDYYNKKTLGIVMDSLTAAIWSYQITHSLSYQRLF